MSKYLTLEIILGIVAGLVIFRFLYNYFKSAKHQSKNNDSSLEIESVNSNKKQHFAIQNFTYFFKKNIDETDLIDFLVSFEVVNLTGNRILCFDTQMFLYQNSDEQFNNINKCIAVQMHIGIDNEIWLPSTIKKRELDSGLDISRFKTTPSKLTVQFIFDTESVNGNYKEQKFFDVSIEKWKDIQRQLGYRE